MSKTVCAVSTAPMKAGVSVIRISGDDAENIIRRIFFKNNPDSLEPWGKIVPRSAHYGLIAVDGKIIDDVLMTFFPAPNSYTGEDTAEISCHGGVRVTAMVLDAVLWAGASPAEAGEFTRRSFINGKTSLTKAEGIAKLLDAKSEQAVYLSGKVARGRLSQEINSIADKLLTPVSSLYAAIDYPEEDMEEISDDELLAAIEECAEKISRLILTSKTGIAITEGIDTVIVGKPNAGKSTLFNTLAGEEKAIVTSVKGTTRDVLEYPVTLGRLLLNLKDTAGIRQASLDEIENIGISLSKKLISSISEGLILALFDLSEPWDESDELLLESLKDAQSTVIPVFCKTDLEKRLDTHGIEAALGKGVYICAAKAEGIDGLAKRIEELFIADDAALSEGRLLTSVRQRDQLRKALDCIEEAKTALTDGLKDACGALLEEALQSLYTLDGRGVSQRIVDDIFSRFCVGK